MGLIERLTRLWLRWNSAQFCCFCFSIFFRCIGFWWLRFVLLSLQRRSKQFCIVRSITRRFFTADHGLDEFFGAGYDHDDRSEFPRCSSLYPLLSFCEATSILLSCKFLQKPFSRATLRPSHSGFDLFFVYTTLF